jgi:purine-cytosine permease-like protein
MWLPNLVIITLVMALQVGIGVYGFYAIRTFEKYTVPVTVVIMVIMSVMAWTQPGVVNWNLTSPLPPGAHFTMLTLLTTAIGVGWGISWVTWASDYSRFVPRSVPSSTVFWYSYVGMYVPTVWLGILGATIASVTQDADPAKMVSAVFGGPVAILVLLLAQHGTAGVAHRARLDRRHRRLYRDDLLRLCAVIRQGVRQLDDRPPPVDEPVRRRDPCRFLHQAARRD